MESYASLHIDFALSELNTPCAQVTACIAKRVIWVKIKVCDNDINAIKDHLDTAGLMVTAISKAPLNVTWSQRRMTTIAADLAYLAGRFKPWDTGLREEVLVKGAAIPPANTHLMSTISAQESAPKPPVAQQPLTQTTQPELSMRKKIAGIMANALAENIPAAAFAPGHILGAEVYFELCDVIREAEYPELSMAHGHKDVLLEYLDKTTCRHYTLTQLETMGHWLASVRANTTLPTDHVFQAR